MTQLIFNGIAAADDGNFTISVSCDKRSFIVWVSRVSVKKKGKKWKENTL